MLAVLCFFGMRYLFAGGGGLGPPSPPSATYAAYTKGFQDGKSGAEFDPIADSPTIVEQVARRALPDVHSIPHSTAYCVSHAAAYCISRS